MEARALAWQWPCRSVGRKRIGVDRATLYRPGEGPGHRRPFGRLWRRRWPLRLAAPPVGIVISSASLRPRPDAVSSFYPPERSRSCTITTPASDSGNSREMLSATSERCSDVTSMSLLTHHGRFAVSPLDLDAPLKSVAEIAICFESFNIPCALGEARFRGLGSKRGNAEETKPC